jgi:non-canonical purine NTP pyrophosphatase (RdgB/HAM1 family)
MKVKYVTGNEIKIKYANQKLNKFGIEVEQVKLEISEIQSDDKLGVATNKATNAFAILSEPCFVTDTFWEIPALNGFPGAFMKYVNEWFQPQDFLNLMRDKNDRRIICHDSITYIDKNLVKNFINTTVGEIAEAIYEDGEEINSIDNLIKFEGKYLKEHHKEHWENSKESMSWNQFAQFLNSIN